MEEFRDISNYVGHYQISNLGRVKSFKLGNESILSPTPNDKGYLTVKLYLGRYKKTYSIQRLVATEFYNYTTHYSKIYVTHIDGNKYNNSTENMRIKFIGTDETPVCNIKKGR